MEKVVEIKEVSSVAEAYALKEKMKYDGNYSIQDWVEGREIVLDFDDRLVHIRWYEQNKVIDPYLKIKTDELSVSTKTTTIVPDNSDVLQGSTVFIKSKRGDLTDENSQ